MIDLTGLIKPRSIGLQILKKCLEVRTSRNFEMGSGTGPPDTNFKLF